VATPLDLGALDEPALCDAAARLGAALRRPGRSGGAVILLEGPVGAGKTTFVRALARGLGVRRPERVCSPTFALCVVHDGPLPLVHVDLYRTEDPAAGPGMGGSLEALGLDALVDELGAGGPWTILREAGASSTRGVLAVEWADLFVGRAACVRVRIEPVEGDPLRRRVFATASADAATEADLAAWADALAQR
jgi:tRNA threonylcarbamoyl adenosine modification protein YjeE